MDEVKVIGEVAWSSKTDKISGIVMEEGHFGSHVDILDELGNDDDIPKAVEYCMQFLWRDISSALISSGHTTRLTRA